MQWTHEISIKRQICQAGWTCRWCHAESLLSTTDYNLPQSGIFTVVLYPGLSVVFHEGPIFFSTLQNWFITPLYSKNVPIIKPTIARSGAICLSRFTSHTAFETFSFFFFLCLTELLIFFSACSFLLFLPYIDRNKKDIQLSALPLRLNCTWFDLILSVNQNRK